MPRDRGIALVVQRSTVMLLVSVALIGCEGANPSTSNAQPRIAPSAHRRRARRARGGAMTPSSPLSGAGNMSKKPYEGGKMPVDSHAAGKDKTSYRSR